MRNPAQPQPTTQDGRVMARLAELEAAVARLQALSAGGTVQAATVDVLPPAGRLGRLAVLSTDGKLYVDTGTAWTAQT